MSAPQVVIVGAGHAGVQAAASLRTEGFDGQIVVLDEHEGSPYQRPPLSKDYLKGEDPAHRTLLRPDAFFGKNSIELRCGPGARVVGVSRSAKTVELADGESISFDHLVIATGATNRPLPVPGGDLESVFQLRTHDDGTRLHSRLRQASRVAVIGGGFVGLEIAASARSLGSQVTVIESLDRLMARSVTTCTADYLAGLHRTMGVDLQLSSTVAKLSEADQSVVVTTGAGHDIEADLVVVGIGAVPATEIADLVGLPTENGILVDDSLQTEGPSIYAIGDCANVLRPDGKRYRLESVQSAVEQAKSVARTICGNPPAAREVPWFWSNQHSAKLQIAGLLATRQAELVLGDAAAGTFSVVCFANNRLIGGESINSPKDHLALRKLLNRGAVIGVEDLADPSVDLMALAARA